MKTKIIFFTDVHQNLDAIQKINFTEYDIVICGGDLLEPKNININAVREIIGCLPSNTYIVPGNCDKGKAISDLINNNLNNIHFNKISISGMTIAGIGCSRKLEDDLMIYRSYFQEHEDEIRKMYNTGLKKIFEYCGIKVVDNKIIYSAIDDSIESHSEYFDKFISFSEKDVQDFFDTSGSLENGILVTHSPPYGILDKLNGLPNIGSKSIRKGILKKRPSLVLCGHFHELPGSVREEGIVYFNPGAVKDYKFGVIEINDGKITTQIVDIK
jgi:Icc-related predicted phosphoesterase